MDWRDVLQDRFGLELPGWAGLRAVRDGRETVEVRPPSREEYDRIFGGTLGEKRLRAVLDACRSEGIEIRFRSGETADDEEEVLTGIRLYQAVWRARNVW